MPQPPKQTFRITGLDCAEEVAALKRTVGPVVGGEERLAFDVLNAQMIVSGEANGIAESEIVAAVKRAGLGAEPLADGLPIVEAPPTFWQHNGRLVLTVVSGIALGTAMIVHHFAAASVVATGLFALAILAGIWLVLPKAIGAIRRAQPDMNLLMTVAVVGAVAIGEWFEAAAVSFLFSVSLLLESWSVGRARRAIAALMDLAPETAHVLNADGSTKEVSPQDVPLGAAFLVKPGERIPLDGRVIDGASDVNQAPITGESQPVAKSPGEDVFAGTINGDGALKIESTRAAGDTTLARIIRMVGDAQAKRGPSEQWVEKFARVYTPTVMLLALAIFLVPPLSFGGQWADWFYRALVLLVIACPCALVISTPVSIVAGIASAARNGVLVKGGVFLEAPAHLRAIAFDKTGTLTAGRPKVVEVVPLSGHSERELIERAAAMEQHSEHPIARAVLEYAETHHFLPAPADDFQVLQGKGARATFDGREFWLGSHRYLEERGQETPEIHEQLETMSGRGQTVVVFGNANHVCGLISLADEVRPGAAAALRELRAAGIEHLIMLTGDNRPTAEAMAAKAGVDQVEAELLPEDKVTAIEALVGKYQHVAMIGDGVNDAPALARASVGIAMGAAGTDAAIETADIALMSDDLSKLPWLIRHSRRVLGVVRQNIAFSLAVKLAFVVLTFAGISSLWGAIAADMGASLLVIANGLRLLR
jgi:Cd2+/Zn2+-exporting ATPase